MAEFNCLTHRFSLDVNDTAAQVSLACKRGDTGIQLRIILTDNGIPYEITPGSAAVFTATKPDGTNLYNYCRIEGNTVVYDFTEQTVNVPGQVDVELRLTYGGMVLTSPSFIIIVDETIYDDLVPTSSNEATALTELIGKSEAAVTACESATANATQSASAAAKSAHEADLAADNARGVAQTVQDMLDSGKFQGETTLPVARASSGDGIAYAATDAGSGCTLPTVSVADNLLQIRAVGKGRQIVFVPEEKNLSTQPTLQINGGEIIQIRMRAPKNQGSNDQSPDATLPVPAGALMRGVPYTLTFCGKYWLVDSQITQFTNSDAARLTKYANRLIELSDSDTIAVPIINSMDGVSDDMAKMFVTRSAEENKNPNENGDVTVPTEKRVKEMIRKDITAAYTGWTPMSGTAKTVANYAKTLADGSYRVADDKIGRYEIEVFTVVNEQQWRILREYTGEFCYISVYCGETLSMNIDTESGYVQVGGRKMLTDWNIPLPTAADVGKLLTASADGSAEWTDMHGVGISTSETVVSDISSDEKLITPAAVQKLIAKINPAPIIITRNSNCDGTERDFLSTKQYQVGDRCTKIVVTEGKLNSHLYECVTAHLGKWDASDFNDLGPVFTAQDGVDMNDYLDAIKVGNMKARIGNSLYLQSSLSDLTGGTKSVQVQNVSSKGALGLGITFGTDGAILGIVATFAGVAST